MHGEKAEKLKTEMKMAPQNSGIGRDSEISRQFSFAVIVAFQTALPRRFLETVVFESDARWQVYSRTNSLSDTVFVENV